MDINRIDKLLSEGKEDEAYKMYMADQTTFHPNVTKDQFLRMWRKHFNNGVSRGLEFINNCINRRK